MESWAVISKDLGSNAGALGLLAGETKEFWLKSRAKLRFQQMCVMPSPLLQLGGFQESQQTHTRLTISCQHPTRLCCPSPPLNRLPHGVLPYGANVQLLSDLVGGCRVPQTHCSPQLQSSFMLYGECPGQEHPWERRCCPRKSLASLMLHVYICTYIFI